MKATNQGETTRLKCEFCEKSFGRKHYLARHIKEVHKSENDEGKFKCDLCDKPSYTVKVNLEKHKEKVHEGIRYNCDLCGMKFTERFTLKRHQISKHSNEKTKMLQCDKCNKYYMSKDAFQRHKRIIHGNVIFKCEICNKEFNTKTRFSTHMEFIHTVQKQEFQCNVCEKVIKHCHISRSIF